MTKELKGFGISNPVHCLSFSSINARGVDRRIINNYRNLQVARLTYEGYKKRCKARLGVGKYLIYPLPMYLYMGLNEFGEREYDPITYPVMRLKWPPDLVVFFNKNAMWKWRDEFEDKMKYVEPNTASYRLGRPTTFYDFETMVFGKTCYQDEYLPPTPENPLWLESQPAFFCQETA